jgi:hypothetical protein
MIIGLNGLKGSGKDTVGQYLVDNWGFEHASFAKKLKESAAALFGIKPETWEEWKNDPRRRILLYEAATDDWYPNLKAESGTVTLTVRAFLQRYGTEAHRTIFGSDFWVEQAMKGIDPNKKIVFTDARFENELERIKSLGGYNVQILRPGLFTEDSHVSEAPPPPHLIDYAIDNDGGFDRLYEQAVEMLAVLTELSISYSEAQ